MQPTPTITLDVRNLTSPEPCLRLASLVECMAPGQVVEVLSDDPWSVSDIIRWCSYEGIEYLDLKYMPNGVDRFLLRKPVPLDRADGSDSTPEDDGATVTAAA